jgi:hypothetical protein
MTAVSASLLSVNGLLLPLVLITALLLLFFRWTKTRSLPRKDDISTTMIKISQIHWRSVATERSRKTQHHFARTLLLKTHYYRYPTLCTALCGSGGGCFLCSREDLLIKT